MRYNVSTLFFLIALILFSCKPKQTSVNTLEDMQEESKTIKPEHNSKNSLDWQGVYTGVLPCEDCMGIQTTLKLSSDNTYDLAMNYLGKPEELGTHDSFKWEENGNVIYFEDRNGEMQRFKVEENQLRYLDQEGNPVVGDLADDYLLKKDEAPILNKYWELTEIMGKPVVEFENMKAIPHILLRSKGEFSANGGCNAIIGDFKLIDKNKISFSNISMTEMECSFDNYDLELKNALEKAEIFVMTDDVHMFLTVGKRMPLAKFEAEAAFPLEKE